MPMVTYPLNNIEYTAEDAEIFHSTRTSGVYATNAFDYSVTGADNTVVIGTGIAWIKNGDFSGKVVAQKESVALDLDLPDPNYPRIDAIVIQFDANKNASEIIIKKGIASSNPVAPSVVRTESEYELHLYHIRRNAGALTISAGNITDLRLNANYCGLMADSVTEVDTDAINAQISEFIDSLRNQVAGIILAQNVRFDPSVSGFESVNVQDAIDEIFEKSEDKLDADAIIDVKHGGTGKTTLTSGYFLKGNGTNAVSAQSAQSARNAMGLGNTTGALPVANGGTGADNINAAARNLMERGSWTPTLKFTNGATFNVTYTTQYGTYLKVGDMVTVAWDLQFTTSGTNWLSKEDYVNVGSLPYTPEMDRWCGEAGTMNIPGFTYGSNGYSCYTRANLNTIAYRAVSGAAVSLKSSYTGTFYFRGTLTYKIS